LNVVACVIGVNPHFADALLVKAHHLCRRSEERKAKRNVVDGCEDSPQEIDLFAEGESAKDVFDADEHFLAKHADPGLGADGVEYFYVEDWYQVSGLLKTPLVNTKFAMVVCQVNPMEELLRHGG
jgi:hypothetical protein